MRRILVLGTTGVLGAYALEALKAKGRWTRVRAARLAADDVVIGDALKPESLGQLCTDIKVVFLAWARVRLPTFAIAAPATMLSTMAAITTCSSCTVTRR